MRNQKNITHNENKTNLIYLVAGGAIGAGVALLFAPKSGRELRSDISTTAVKGYDQAKEFTANISEKAGNVYEHAQEKALDTFHTAKEGLNSTLEAAKENFSNGVDKVKTLPKKAQAVAAGSLEKIADKAENIAQEIKRQ